MKGLRTPTSLMGDPIFPLCASGLPSLPVLNPVGDWSQCFSTWSLVRLPCPRPPPLPDPDFGRFAPCCVSHHPHQPRRASLPLTSPACLFMTVSDYAFLCPLSSSWAGVSSDSCIKCQLCHLLRSLAGWMATLHRSFSIYKMWIAAPASEAPSS